MTAEGIVGEYEALRADTDADLVAMQMGDFYEFFGDAARTVEAELDLKISERSSGGELYEMAGVPVDELDPYLTALVERGYRVAVADQYEVEGGHERAITRVITPGTLLESTDEGARYLASVVRQGDTFGLGLVDVSTGRFQVTEITGSEPREKVFSELYRFAPVEVLPGPDLQNDDAFMQTIRETLDTTITTHGSDAFDPAQAHARLREQFGDGAAESVGVGEQAIRATGGALDYIDETGIGVLASITRLRQYAPEEQLDLDATTQRTLELTEPMTEGGTSLLATIDHTVTSSGRRLLAERLVRPTRDIAELQRRQDCVEALAADAMARERLADLLNGSHDLARLAARATTGSLQADGLHRVRDTLNRVPELMQTIESAPQLRDSPIRNLISDLDDPAALELLDTLDGALSEQPREIGDGAIQPEFDDELAAVAERHEAAVEWVDGLADQEQDRLDIQRLSVGRNKTDGYYVQVAKSEADAVPDEYEGIKTLKNAERFVLPALQEREREIRRLEARREAIERAIITELRETVAELADTLQPIAQSFAALDLQVALATHAVRNDWTRPEITEDDVLDIDAGRHPVVEQTVEFVPNDIQLDRDRRFLIVTGPNMSGKSTYMRQVALITLLAQVGSFVPAGAAEIGIVDGIYTRVGALDELAEGRSTFMVEMQELSNILHSATQNSLVILDEVGRGTATYDGIAIAWAATEYLHNSIGAKTLFATHYHELTRLADHLGHVANVHMTATEEDGDVTFRRTVRDGPADRSYGVHVAELAGVPNPVVDRAGTVLEQLRDEESIAVKGGEGQGETRQVVFDLETERLRKPTGADGGQVDEGGDKVSPADSSAEHDVLAELRTIEIAELSPVELMGKIQSWQEDLDEE
jgi:DNA mismatch repair protein MutS